MGSHNFNPSYRGLCKDRSGALGIESQIYSPAMWRRASSIGLQSEVWWRAWHFEDFWRLDHPFQSELLAWLLCFSNLQLEPNICPWVYIIHVIPLSWSMLFLAKYIHSTFYTWYYTPVILSRHRNRGWESKGSLRPSQNPPIHYKTSWYEF